MQMHPASCNSKAPAPAPQPVKDGASSSALDLQKGNPAGREVVLAAAVVDVCLFGAAMAGAALLTWWALAFHPSYSQLWMVPVGLVLACTPPVVCLALHFSDSRVPGKGGAGAPPPPLLSAVVVEK
ncbi:uncharacterized protein LOC133899527 [Phragmites australis]|uniref:uncharacterized protein LOC133899527 n=1 Tax=Phragmites australis TaxID=29695 RepID=UPI002D790746|nr:uncharacterized protein LOC133899527 [Phragmites australis]